MKKKKEKKPYGCSKPGGGRTAL